jgi:hypothetical protein
MATAEEKREAKEAAEREAALRAQNDAAGNPNPSDEDAQKIAEAEAQLQAERERIQAEAEQAMVDAEKEAAKGVVQGSAGVTFNPETGTYTDTPSARLKSS